MSELVEAGSILRSALFIDFDNIYIGLRSQDSVAASEFASQPGRWIHWMEREMERPAASRGAFESRRLLMRRCYLNPANFGTCRPAFTRAGFEVVDCPQLTKQAKNSADIRIAMDVLDALQHRTYFDEFIILSSDSDFTPVLLRLRSHDRRTTVLTVGNISGAYQSACDLTVEAEDFLENALSGADLPDPGLYRDHEQPAPAGNHELLERIAQRVHAQASVSGTLEPVSLPSIYREFEEFRASTSWLGYFRLRDFTKAVVDTRSDLRIEGIEPWVVAVESLEAPASGAEVPGGDSDELRHRIADQVVNMLQRAEEPVQMVAAANELRQGLGVDIDRTNWAGAGTFKGLLARLAVPDLEFSAVPPGFIYDRERHQPPQPRQTAGDIADRHPDLVPVVRQVHQLTNVPDLAPEAYGVLYRLIAEETDANGYSLTRTSKQVRDTCLSEDLNLSRKQVAFVLKGLVYSGVNFKKGEGANDPEELARMFSDNVLDLCENAGLSMDDGQRAMIKRWLGADE